MAKIFVAGTVSWDTIIQMYELPTNEPGCHFAKDCYDMMGGTSAGKATNMHKLGMDVLLGTKYAKDEAGDKVERSLLESEISFFRDVDPKCTETHTNLMDGQGNRVSIYTRTMDMEYKIDLSRFYEAIEEADLIFLDICPFVRQLFPIIEKAKKKVWVDIHDYDGKNDWHQQFMKYATGIFMSSDLLEKEKEYQKVMSQIIETGKEFVVCTHGKEGAEILTGEGQRHKTGIIKDFKLKDSNGAGDSFVTGFLYGYQKKKSYEECLKYGTIVAGLTVMSDKLYHPDLSPDLLEELYVKYQSVL